jgi:ABC-type antimicrobial peptide transport system permease subunit
LNDLVDYFAPINLNRPTLASGRDTEVVARLKRGVSVYQAQAEMDAIANRMAEKFPDTNKGWTIHVVSIAEALLSKVRQALLILTFAAAFVLLIACANVGVLLTFSAVERFHEVAVRAALGAGHGRLARQFII